jgi:cation-transporting ATPase I
VIGTVMRTTMRMAGGAAGLMVGTVTRPVRTAETVARSATSSLETAAGLTGRLRRGLVSLLDPSLHRDRRIEELGRRVLVEVHELGTERGPEIAAALERRLRRSADVRWWRINVVTGQVVVGTDGDPADVVAAVEEVERAAGVAEHDWDLTVDFPSDLEPRPATGMSRVTDLGVAGLAATGALTPRRAPVELFRTVAAVADTQPRIRGALEELDPSDGVFGGALPVPVCS